MTIEHRREHFKRVRVGILFHVAQYRHLVGHGHDRQFGRRFQRQPAQTVLRRFALRFAFGQGARLDRTIMLLRQLEDGIVIDVADDDDESVVRRIPALIPIARILYGHALQIVHPADDRHAVGMRLESRSRQLFEEPRLRLIVGAQAALLHDDPDLLRVFLRIERQVPHAIGLQMHHLPQFLFRHLLEICGVILAGEGIVAPAGCGDEAAELAGANARRTLEHHVFQQVRHTGRPVVFIHAAGVVPDHVHGRRRAPVFLDDDAQAVRQLVLERVGPCRQGQAGAERQRGKSENPISIRDTKHTDQRLLLESKKTRR